MTFQEQYEQTPDPRDLFHNVSFHLGLGQLGTEAREVVNLILTCPGELVDWTLEKADISMGSVREYMRACGWKHKKIDRAFQQIKSMLKAV